MALILDYQKISAVVNDESWFRDDWSEWLDEQGWPKFARHRGSCNVLQLNGSVTAIHHNELDPEVESNLVRWMPGFVPKY